MSALLPHIFGFSGLAFIVLAWQFNDRNTILLMNVTAFVAFSIELLLLDAIVGSIMMLAAAAKATVAIFTQRKWIVALFIVAPLIFCAFHYAHWYDLLTMTAHVTGALTFFSKKVKRMRILAPIGTILWAIHNAIVGAWGQLVADMFILTSMAIGAVRHWREERQIA